MKAIIISIVVVGTYLALNVSLDYFGAYFHSEVVYESYMKLGNRANYIVKDIEQLLIDLPDNKHHDELKSYLRPKDSTQEFIETEGYYNIRYHNLIFEYREDGALDTIWINNLIQGFPDSTIVYPKISNLQYDASSYYENYYQPMFFWEGLVLFLGLFVIFNFVYFIFRKKPKSLISIQVYLIAMLSLNLIYFGYYQKHVIYDTANVYASATQMGPLEIVSPNLMLNLLAINTHVYATVFDISILCLLLFGVTLFIQNRIKVEV